MKRLSALVASGLFFAATTFTGQAAATTVCQTVPGSTPPVYVDTNNDGNPEAYLGSVQDPTVCIDLSPTTGLRAPEVGTCGAACVYVKVTVLPVTPNVAGYVSVNYAYDGSPQSITVPFDTDMTYSFQQTICVKIGGSGVC